MRGNNFLQRLFSVARRPVFAALIAAAVAVGVLDVAEAQAAARDLYVLDTTGSKVIRYDGVTGALVGDFVTAGLGGLTLPFTMGFGPDGNLYVSSYWSNTVVRYNGTTGALIGDFVTPGLGGLNGPRGLAFGPDGNLYVTSENNNKVVRYNGATGALMGDFVTPGLGGLGLPNDLVFGPDANLYAVSYSNSKVISYNGVTGALIGDFVTPGLGGLSAPFGLVFGPDANLCVSSASASTQKVIRYNGVTGALIGDFVTSGLGGLTQPTSLKFGPPATAPPSLSISDVTAFEGNSGTTAFNFTVTLSAAPTGDVSVDWYTSSGTAIPGPDYTGGTGTLMWTTDDPPSKTITIQVNGDTVVEPDEDFTVRLQNPVNATISSGVGTGTILNDDAAAAVPTVSTTAVSAITQATANGGGNVTSDGGSPVTDRGVCWSTTTNPTTADTCTSNGAGTGSFTCSMNGLTPGTTYHVRAYATNSVGTAYGNDLQFAAAAAAGTVDVPTMDEWGMIIFILCAGLAAAHRMRRRMPE